MTMERPLWPVPKAVQLGWTTRQGGRSKAPFDGNNQAHHVGDETAAVDANRVDLIAGLEGCERVCWLSQMHGTRVVDAGSVSDGAEADAAIVTQPGVAAAVMTADCLPVFFWQDDGAQVAIAHAGWRGLAAGILSETLQQFDDPSRVRCGFGPAIGPEAYEVGMDVIEAFASWPGAQRCFKPAGSPGKWLADLPQLADFWLQEAGVPAVYRSQACTLTDAEHYYSYRRDGTTGRMVNLIWIQS
jgi:YfiH family protein